MQPLRRYTQCGSLTMLFGVFIVLFGVSSTALTTFGKSSNLPPPTSIPKVKGRECTTHDDCNGIDKTSCVRDDEYKWRCLCGDDEAPRNGLCEDGPKGLHHRCSNNNDCYDSMICQIESTNRTIGGAKFISSKTKVCLCDNESGYVEDTTRDICSGTVATITNVIMSLVSTWAPFLIYKHMKVAF